MESPFFLWLLRRLLGEDDARALLSELREQYEHRLEVEGVASARKAFHRDARRALGLAFLARIRSEPSSPTPRTVYSSHAHPRPAVMDNLLQDLRFGFRSLRRRPLFTAIAILTLPDYGHEPYILQAWVSRESYRPEPVPFGPQEVWSLGWDGAFITGYASEYRFEIRYRDGRTTVIERAAEPVRVLPGEKAWATDRSYGIMRDFDPDWNWNGPPIPDVKPWYVAIIPDRSGRLWVLREGEGHPVEGWTEPEGWKGWERNPGWVPEAWFDVFEEATGRFLGRVDAPPGFSAEPEPLIEGPMFICLTGDELGRPIVRRFRLELPPPLGVPSRVHPLPGLAAAALRLRPRREIRFWARRRCPFRRAAGERVRPEDQLLVGTVAGSGSLPRNAFPATDHRSERGWQFYDGEQEKPCELLKLVGEWNETASYQGEMP